MDERPGLSPSAPRAKVEVRDGVIKQARERGAYEVAERHEVRRIEDMGPTHGREGPAWRHIHRVRDPSAGGLGIDSHVVIRPGSGDSVRESGSRLPSGSQIHCA